MAAGVFAVIDYRAGTARLPPKFKYMMVNLNPDPVTRLVRLRYYQPTAPLQDLDNWMFDIPYERGLTALSMVFGPMRGTYAGPYPTEEQAILTLQKNGRKLTSEEVKSGKFLLEGQLIEARLGVEDPSSLDRWVVAAALYNNDCIVEGAIPKSSKESSPPTFERIVLRDRESGRRFASFPIRGNYDLWPGWKNEHYGKILPANRSHRFKVWKEELITWVFGLFAEQKQPKTKESHRVQASFT